MNKTFLFVNLLILSSISFAQTKCRTIIDEYFKFAQKPASAFIYSDREFSDYELSQEQFNNLSENEQVEIFERIKPMPMKVEEVQREISRGKQNIQDRINRLLMSFSPQATQDLNRYFNIMDKLREYGDGLDSCET